ncbi:MAG: DUF6470 family protein [Eubacterium sp.]|jgi:hypothetical protein|nr:DUF6470 family protein [Eubacterium sp.]
MDTNLLNITTIPIVIKVNIVNASLQNPLEPSPMINVKTGEGGYRIDAQPAKINVDTYQARSSMGYGNYNYNDFNKAEAQKGISLAYEGIAKIVNNGNKLARGAKASEIAIQNKRAGATIQTIMEYLPKEGADITFDKGQLNINYQMRDVNIDWDNLQISELEYNPGKIELSVEQMPRVEIEYTGSPIYVPPSADPNYEGD